MLPLLSALLIEGRWERPLPYIPVPLNNKKNVGDYFDFEFVENSSPHKDFFNDFKKKFEEGKGQELVRYMQDHIDESKHFNFIKGVFYEYGLQNLDINESLARKYYSLAAEKGSNLAKCRIAILDNSPKCPKDCWCCQLSNQLSGFDNSFIAALIHTYDFEYTYRNFFIERFPAGGIPEDANKAALKLNTFLGIDVERGNSKSLITQAVLKLKAKDYQGAVKDLEKAAKDGQHVAYGLLGRLYLPKDPYKAMDYYNEGISHKDLYSVTDSSLHVLRSDPQNKDVAKFMDALKGAVDQKYPRAMGEYGYIMYNDRKNFFKNKTEAIQLIDDSIRLGYTPAIYYKTKTSISSNERNYLITLLLRKSYLADAINIAYRAASFKDYKYAALIYDRHKNIQSPDINYNFHALQALDKSIKGEIQTTFDQFMGAIHNYDVASSMIDKYIEAGLPRIMFKIYLLTYHPKYLLMYLIIPGIFVILFIVLIFLTYCRVKKTMEKVKKE